VRDYIIFMHLDAIDRHAATDSEQWSGYLTWLRGTGQFEGGSSIGEGECLRKGQTSHFGVTGLSGYIRVRAHDFEQAKALLAGNPVYEAGGTLEIRKLPRT
jgi:hypothetical protein